MSALACHVINTSEILGTIQINVHVLLADRTNGRAIGTVLRLSSVCRRL